MSTPQPHRFQIGIRSEIRRHGGLPDLHRTWHGIYQFSGEVPWRDAAEIRAAQDPGVGCQDFRGQRHQLTEVFLSAEDFPIGVAGKCGRVEHDGVEQAFLFGESPEPVECVAFAEMVGFRIEMVMGEIAFRPIEIRL